MNTRLHTSFKLWSTLSIAVSLSLLADSAQAVQRTPERSLVGVVESVDAANSSVTLKPQGKSAKTMKLGIRTQTVVRTGDGKRTMGSQIVPGATVEVRYRTHLLGIPQASRILVR